MTEQEFAIHYRVLKAHMADMTDWFQEEIREVLFCLKQDVHKYHLGGKEPDWQDYADSINEILREDGMPALFASVNEEVYDD